MYEYGLDGGMAWHGMEWHFGVGRENGLVVGVHTLHCIVLYKAQSTSTL